MLENMRLAFSAIRANKMHSFLTMLGIIIGIGSVISIVSIGDSMRAMVADQYKSVGINRAMIYVQLYDSEDYYRESDYFTMADVELSLIHIFIDVISLFLFKYNDDDTILRNKILFVKKYPKIFLMSHLLLPYKKAGARIGFRLCLYRQDSLIYDPFQIFS